MVSRDSVRLFLLVGALNDIDVQRMARKLDELGFKSSKADFVTWSCPASKNDGEEYYAYVILYVDDVMAASHNTIKVMKGLRRLSNARMIRLNLQNLIWVYNWYRRLHPVGLSVGVF